MIRPLRRRHRLMVCTLGVSLPIALFSGIAGRRPVPLMGSLPSKLAAPRITPGNVVWTKTDLWPNQRIITLLRRDATGSTRVELQSNLLKPDVLIYWSPANNSATTRLPENARLLGALANGSPVVVASYIRARTGQLLLYSLADHEVIAVSKPLTL